MANKFDGDVRPLSNDPRYMGVVFEGFLGGDSHSDNAIVQARAAKEWPLSEQPCRPMHISRDRWNLLEHLNLARYYTVKQVTVARVALMVDMEDDFIGFLVDEAVDEVRLLALQSEWEQGDKSMTWTEFKNADRKPPKRAPAPSKPSVFSLEYAMARWPDNFKVQP